MRRLQLHHWILIAMALGAALGLGLHQLGALGFVTSEYVSLIAGWAEQLGAIFLKALQMLVVPLIVSSLISSVAGVGDLRKLGKLGARTIGFYLLTSALAIVTGIAIYNLLDALIPLGRWAPAWGEVAVESPVAAGEEARSVGTILWDQVARLVPSNPLQAAAQGDMLPIIFFSLLLGVFISLTEHGSGGPEPAPTEAAEDGEGEAQLREEERRNVVVLRRFWQGLFTVMMRMTVEVIRLAPFGVFGFIFHAAASQGIEPFVGLGRYVVTVALGLAVHALLTLPLLYRLWLGRWPGRHYAAMKPALLTAFSTASSNGTLPLTLRCVEESGVPRRVSSFVLPLGATINMDGTALYEAVAVLFIAEATGMDLSLGQQVVVALTALLASVGAAGIPHAGTVMMVVVLGAVGLPIEGVGLILAVDRVLDMARTTVNVWSDSMAAAVVAHLSGDLAEPEADPS